MNHNVDCLELVKQAQLGCQESMSRLTQVAKGSLCAYIYRLTLNNDLAEDLLQETLLEMVKSLKNLKFERANQFWAWLYRTALGKVQFYIAVVFVMACLSLPDNTSAYYGRNEVMMYTSDAKKRSSSSVRN